MAWASVLTGQRSVFVVLLVLALIGCSSSPATTPAVPGQSAGVPASNLPAASDQPTEAPSSSQALIAADLAAGTIDIGTALEYRAWALFFDPRLPERYDGAGSLGEDQSLFREIASNLETLPEDQRTELERYLLRPTDPRSPFTGQPSATASIGATLADTRVVAVSELQQCSEPRQWFSEDWSPDGSADQGFRVWACGANKAIVQDDLTKVTALGSRLWLGMTYAEPDGMGLPLPDTAATHNDGNGKIDVYLLEPLAQCRPRDDCEGIPGDAVAAAISDFPANCTRPGFPANGCSGYMLLDRTRMDSTEFAADFAHEFFHILQMAHNGKVDLTWYHEASAVWAEWAFERESGKSGAYEHYNSFQNFGQSLLWYFYDSDVQYRSWGWPLYQSVEEGPSNVFETWSAIESAQSRTAVDKALDQQLSFASEFRNFAVRNAQPAAYIQGSSTGLESDTWQTKPDLGDFPTTPHKVKSLRSQLSLGKDEHRASIDPLDAQYDEFEVIDERIRQIEIDITELRRTENADLDVLAQIGGGSGDTWTRFQGRGGKLKLCRDIAAENVDSLMMVVISNHNFDRTGDVPDPGKRLEGSYTIESKDTCDERELHLGGTITWNAEAVTFDGQQTYTVSGSANVVIAVKSPYLLTAERDGGSTYSYDYTDNVFCGSSHEQGTLESFAGVGTTDEWDYSIGMLNPGGPIGEDLVLQIIIRDYCGESMGGDVDPLRPSFNGFPSCSPSGSGVTAMFDGVENYVINCDVATFNGYNADMSQVDSVSGHISGNLRPLDGPHPTPPY